MTYCAVEEANTVQLPIDILYCTILGVLVNLSVSRFASHKNKELSDMSSVACFGGDGGAIEQILRVILVATYIKSVG